jgi:hypothetical protein
MFGIGRYNATADHQDHQAIFTTLSRKYSVKTVRLASKIEAVTGAALCSVRLCKCMTDEAKFKPWSLLGDNAFCVL